MIVENLEFPSPHGKVRDQFITIMYTVCSGLLGEITTHRPVKNKRSIHREIIVLDFGNEACERRVENLENFSSRSCTTTKNKMCGKMRYHTHRQTSPNQIYPKRIN
jgi:hypothetical protein